MNHGFADGEEVATILARLAGLLSGQDASPRLRPPAGLPEIEEVERAIGRPIPDDLRSTYLAHDGQDDEGKPWLFDGRRWLAVGAIAGARDLARSAEGGRGRAPPTARSGRSPGATGGSPSPRRPTATWLASTSTRARRVASGR